MADIAITCEGVWKSYRAYHQRSHTLKEKVLSLRNHYEEFWALKGIDLEVPSGSSIGIIGANGSGKSTLLKTVARILTPNRGSVSVAGTLSSLLELGIGFHPELTGRENVYLGGSFLGLTRRDIDARYDEIVEFAGIGDFMDLAVKNFSSGMYARLAFALAISVDPEVLLVDEVLAVGDENFQIRCHERIAEFRAEGRTVMLVSHSLESIRSLCDRAAWVDDGLVKEAGLAHDVVTSYRAQVHGIIEEETQTHSGRRLGSGQVLITDVAFLDDTGASKTTFHSGEGLTVRLAYRAKEPVSDALCCFAVYKADDMTYVIGRNSKDRGRGLVLSGEGVIEFSVASLPLVQGAYIISLGLQDEAVHKVYDWHDRAYSINVVPGSGFPEEAGVVHVDGTWTTSNDEGREAQLPAERDPVPSPTIG